MKSKFTWCFIILLFSQYTIQAQPLQSRGLRMVQVLSRIQNSYVDSVNVNKLEEEAIRQVVKQLDPHSTFVKKDDAKRHKELLNGSFVGVGVLYNFVVDTPTVLQTIKNGPAFDAGLEVGDRIISVDGKPSVGKDITSKTISQLLRGEKGSKVVLRVKRTGKRRRVRITIKRDRIYQSCIDAAYEVSPTIGYLKLNKFGKKSSNEVLEVLHDFRKKGITDLIFDLRDNGGGYLNSVVKIANNFIEKGKLIVYTEGVNKPMQEYVSNKNGIWEKGRVVLLINESSASASEILAGAIQDWDRGVVIGRRSYGKGLVQNTYNLFQGDVLRLTIAKYYTPSGRLIQKPYDKGVEAYSQDLIERYNRGELSNKDSIHFPSADKYYTKNTKRVVYAGGGIMPDIFVPLDEKRYPEYYISLKKNKRLYQLVDSFYLQSYTVLKVQYPTFDSFKRGYSVPKTFLKTLKNSCLEDISLSSTSEQEYTVQQHIKANFARNLWSKTEYYQVIGTHDQNVIRAINVLNHPELYDNKLTVAK